MFGNAIKKAFEGLIDFDTDTIKAMLVTSVYTPNQDTHDNVDDVTNEVVGTGYTAGGQTLANCAIAVDSVNDRVEFDADNPSWANSTITARGMVIYKDTGTPGTSPLICYIDFGEDKISSAGAFTATINAEGIFYIGYAQA